MQCSSSSNITSNVSVDPRVANAAGLALYQLYIFAGVPTVAANLVCLVVFVSKQKLRDKYSLFAALTVGDLLNALGMLLAGIFRTRLILNNDYSYRSSFACLRNSWPHFYIIGGQLSAFILVLMGVERVVAVYQPVWYKMHISIKIRFIAISQCLLAAIISLLIGYLCSYLNSNQCVIATCSILNTTGRAYSNYNYIIVIIFPIVALILNILTYIGARASSSSETMRRELHKVLSTLAISACSVAFIDVPNVFLWGYVRYWNPVIMPYLFIAFCCYSTINLFVYFALKRDFRRHLLSLISCGYFKFKGIADAENKLEIRIPQVQVNSFLVRSTKENTSPTTKNTGFSLSACTASTTHF